LDLDAIPKSLKSEYRTPKPWSGGAPRPKGLRSAPCHTQVTWVKHSFATPSFLDLEGDVRRKLIIIITTTTTIIIIDFILQIKSIFFQ
jgi:hypothetical protein